jgi:tRNA(Ile2) C34 agmatinyltransferase TiaS
MACPTCNHTMENLGTEVVKTFWCPRCGTLKTVHEDGFEDVTPTFWAGRFLEAAKAKGETL